jgi:small subunit ribosomal protein S5
MDASKRWQKHRVKAVCSFRPCLASVTVWKQGEQRGETLVRVNPDELSLKDKVVFINRVAKVVKGGKRFNFCALVVVGDGQGWVGIGKGKAAEVPVAISKAVEQAKKNLVHVALTSGTIAHEVHGLFGAEHVLLKPAQKGAGIIAGGAVRAVVEVAGVHNIIAKTLGRGNPFNTVRATLNGLCQLRNAEDVLNMRRNGVGDAQNRVSA